MYKCRNRKRVNFKDDFTGWHCLSFLILVVLVESRHHSIGHLVQSSSAQLCCGGHVVHLGHGQAVQVLQDGVLDQADAVSKHSEDCLEQGKDPANDSGFEPQESTEEGHEQLDGAVDDNDAESEHDDRLNKISFPCHHLPQLSLPCIFKIKELSQFLQQHCLVGELHQARQQGFLVEPQVRQGGHHHALIHLCCD